MVYPLFEYMLVVYVVLDFFMFYLSYKNGYVGKVFWTFAKLSFPFQIALCALFRMIFVIIAYIDVRGHTFGFMCLQMSLFTVTILNAAYILEIRPTLGLQNAKSTSWVRGVFWTYIIGDIAIMIVKLYLTMFVVFGWGSENMFYPHWGLYKIFGGYMVIGELVDIIWMIFNAILPLIISFLRMRYEPKMEVTIKLEDIKHVHLFDLSI